jgi:hypothetical protein
VELAVILGAIIGGVTGLAGTLAAGYLQRRATARAQRQTWRAEAYVALLQGLNRERIIIQRTFPVIGSMEDPPPSTNLEVAELVQAKLGAHSSAAMRALLDRWIAARIPFIANCLNYMDALKDRDAVKRDAELRGISFREAAGGQTAHDYYGELDRARIVLIGQGTAGGILAEIEAEARKELGYKD